MEASKILGTANVLSLYDLEWVALGCPGSPPKGTDVDDTFGTYSSNYVIAVVGFAAGLWLLCNPKVPQMYKVYGVMFFWCTGLGYAKAGVLQQVYHEDDEHPIHTYSWKASYIFTLLGILGINLLCNSILFERFPSIGGCAKCINLVAYVGAAAIIAYVAFKDFADASLLFTGVYSCVVTLYCLLVFALVCDWPKVLGVAVIIASYVVQVVLAPKCGSAAYADCFKDCPLPAPYFNHNALFMWLFAIGLGILGVSMNLQPNEATEQTHFMLLK